eukprot:4264683-Prymnesium_polylepis.1
MSEDDDDAPPEAADANEDLFGDGEGEDGDEEPVDPFGPSTGPPRAPQAGASGDSGPSQGRAGGSVRRGACGLPRRALRLAALRLPRRRGMPCSAASCSAAPPTAPPREQRRRDRQPAA